MKHDFLTNENAEGDLRHFLDLALAQVRHRSKAENSAEDRRMLGLLEELILEQNPTHGSTNGNDQKENSDSATRSSR